MNTKDILINLGFKKHQASIYLACLELGMATPSEIAKKAGVVRPYFYDLVEDLIKDGLVIKTIKGKRKYFYAENPEKILQNQQNKLKAIEALMPQLKSIHNTTANKPEVSFYEGRSGINKVYDDALKNEGEIIAFTTEKFLLADGKELSNDYIQKRVRAKIPLRVIGPASKELIELKSKDEKELRQTKILPQEIFTSDIELGIYSNKVDFINFNKEFGLIIESKEIADVMKRIFEIIWRSGQVIE